MPFADMDGVVGARLEQFGHGLLGRRHAQIVKFFGVSGLLLVDKRRAKPGGVGIEFARHARHGTGRWRELNPKAPRVTPRHQRGARHGAHRSSGIALVKAYTVTGDRIDMGRGHALRPVTAAVGGDVVEAEIVRKDDNDVGGALRQRLVGLRRSGHPRHWAVRITRIDDVGVPAQ